MINIIRGASIKPISTNFLIEYVESSGLSEGILYTGYPIVGSIEDIYSIDGLLISRDHAIIVFDIVEESSYSDREYIKNDLYNVIFQKLLGYKELTKSRGQLKVNICVCTIAPSWNNKYKNSDTIITKADFLSFLEENKQIDFGLEDYKRVLQSIQSITKLKSRPARKILSNLSKGAFLNEIEKSISNLDTQQSKAVIETVDGVQRIRGLAGSGKTIVLALKVAYLHANFPDWMIGVTFYTRSLKNQFIELITKFTIEHKNEEPDWSKIKIQQAWGSSKDSGFYYEFCNLNNIEYLDYVTAKNRYGSKANLLDELSKNAILEAKSTNEIYDAILVDEAQDFTEAFLKLCYLLLKPIPNNNSNKRLIYAYDELQKLNDIDSLSNPTTIFPGIDFNSHKNQSQHDIILDKCYRNSAPVLVTAHALGFGIYRDEQLVTMFKDKELWKDVGYKVDEGELELGKLVVLKRDSEESFDNLTKVVPQEDIIQFKRFENNYDQYEYVSSQIIKNLKEDELSYRDIIVIHPNPLQAKNELAHLRKLLFDNGIASHLAGINTSPDDFFIENSVVFTSIFRAKGNEAAMVYIVGSEFCYGGYELIKKRNILFTAITRSKVWVRVYGIGEEMEKLVKEFFKVKDAKYKLKFCYPTIKEMEHMNLLHRDLSKEDIKAIDESKNEALNLTTKFRNKKVHLQDLPKDIIEELKKYLNENK